MVGKDVVIAKCKLEKFDVLLEKERKTKQTTYGDFF